MSIIFNDDQSRLAGFFSRTGYERKELSSHSDPQKNSRIQAEKERQRQGNGREPLANHAPISTILYFKAVKKSSAGQGTGKGVGE
jgi:hypothetical protein